MTKPVLIEVTAEEPKQYGFCHAMNVTVKAAGGFEFSMLTDDGEEFYIDCHWHDNVSLTDAIATFVEGLEPGHYRCYAHDGTFHATCASAAESIERVIKANRESAEEHRQMAHEADRRARQIETAVLSGHYHELEGILERSEIEYLSESEPTDRRDLLRASAWE